MNKFNEIGELMSPSASVLESKVVVLGLSQSGKTSIRQVVFEGFAPEATALNPATVRINRKLFNLAGGGINLFDIGKFCICLILIFGFKKYVQETTNGKICK